jgi:hypothetical protein
MTLSVFTWQLFAYGYSVFYDIASFRIELQRQRSRLSEYSWGLLHQMDL